MLEYFSYKKYKKYKAEKEREKEQGRPKEEASSSAAAASASGSKPSNVSPALPRPKTEPEPKDKLKDKKPGETPVLDEDDESFFERLTSGGASAHEAGGGGDGDDDAASRPPLPPRVKTPDLSWDSDSESFVREPRAGKDKVRDKDKGETGKKDGPSTADKIGRRISLLVRSGRSKTKKEVRPTNLEVPRPEADKEKDDLTRVLDQLNLSARNNRAFSLSEESSELLRKFTVVLKDLVNGVPTAVDDLKGLLDDRDGLLAKNYEKLPSSIKKLVTQLPTKLTSTLAPELLAVAAASQGVEQKDSSKAGLKSTAKTLLLPKNLTELVAKPGAIVSMLKAIMNALKVRWPAFVGSNVIWSVALFVLLFVLWYCHKRGREVRLEKEESAKAVAAAGVEGRRVEELPDDPALPAAESSSQAAPIIVESRDDDTSKVKLPAPPVGSGATAHK